MKLIELNEEQYAAVMLHLELIESLPSLMVPHITFNYNKALPDNPSTKTFASKINNAYYQMRDERLSDNKIILAYKIALIYKDTLIAFAKLDYNDDKNIVEITELESKLIPSDIIAEVDTTLDDCVIKKPIYDSNDNNSILSLFYNIELMEMFEKYSNSEDDKVDVVPGYEDGDDGYSHNGGLCYKNNICEIIITESKQYNTNRTIITLILKSKIPYIFDDLASLITNKISFTSNIIPHESFLKLLGNDQNKIRFIHVNKTMNNNYIYQALCSNGYITDCKNETGVYVKEGKSDIFINIQRNRCFIISDDIAKKGNDWLINIFKDYINSFGSWVNASIDMNTFNTSN